MAGEVRVSESSDGRAIRGVAPALATGAITADTLTMAGHLLMFPTMLAAMLLRRQDYTHHVGTWPWRNRRTDRVATIVASNPSAPPTTGTRGGLSPSRTRS